MYLLILSQGDYEIKTGLFETLEEGRNFAEKLPGYSRFSDDDGYIYESLALAEIPDYYEVKYNDNIVPVSRFSFLEDADVDIFWLELPVISERGDGIVEGASRVDAYSVNNSELKDYISKRESKYVEVAAYLTERGCDVERNFFDSEDGEAIVYRRKGESDWHFLTHLDPCFVNDDIADILSEFDSFRDAE